MPDVPAANAHAFTDRWKASGASERANFQPFVTELCDLLGVAHPAPAQAAPRNGPCGRAFHHSAIVPD